MKTFGKNGIEIHCADNVEFMKTLPANHIDLTVTSPPYDNLRTYTGKSKWNREKFLAAATELYRVTKEGGVVVWVVGDQTINGSETGSSFWQALQFMEIGFSLADTMVWIKDGGGAIGSNLLYTQNFEYMFLLSKGKIKASNLIRDKANLSAGKDKSGVGRRLQSGEHKIELRKVGADFSKRNNWWYVPVQRGEHPAVFPEALANDHILSWSNADDLIFDPFNGSGTTLKQAYLLNRRGIGCDDVEEYCEIAAARLEKTMAKSPR